METTPSVGNWYVTKTVARAGSYNVLKITDTEEMHKLPHALLLLSPHLFAARTHDKNRYCTCEATWSHTLSVACGVRPLRFGK